MQLMALLLAAGLPTLTGLSFGPAPTMSITNMIDPFFNVTIGAPGSCSCQVPQRCDGHQIGQNATETYSGATGCDYYAIGGGIDAVTRTGAAGVPCHTWRADYKSCAVYPGSTDEECGRIVNATCSRSGTAVTLHAVIDKQCTTYHYQECDAKSICCGGFTCTVSAPGAKQMLCCPPGGCAKS